MVKLVGPLFSLSATGALGDYLFYYESPYGPVVRSKKRYYKNAAQYWTVNQEWFKAANIASKNLNLEQKWAWNAAYPQMCDSWRDIFVGHQIEAWNLSPENNLTWPNVPHELVEDVVFSHGVNSFEDNSHRIFPVNSASEKFKRNCSNYLYWAGIFPDFNYFDYRYPPTNRFGGINFSIIPGKLYYMWAGVRYTNGEWNAQFIGTFQA